jgi:hypothetical protein
MDMFTVLIISAIPMMALLVCGRTEKLTTAVP